MPVAPIVLVVAGLVVALLAVLLAARDDGSSDASGGEVFLEAAAAEGPDPFTAATDPAAPASTALAAPAEGPIASPAAGVVPASGVAPPPGSPPYGGSGDDRVCDREQLVAFLTDQPDRAAAWSGVLGVPVDEIGSFVRSLTPTVLLYDTRVTNHGFADGRATPRQSVLQAGTAVLVDGNGDPVVRCRCGNPLLPPVAVAQPVPVGDPWPGYQVTVVVAISAGVTVVAPDASPAASETSTTPSSSGDASSTTGSVPPETETTSSLVGDVTDLERSAVEGLVAVVSECRPDAAVTVIDVEDVEGFTGSYTALLDVGGTQMLFMYEPATGVITEGDRASAELLTTCGVL